jgi:hypothetical protein
MDLCSLLPRNLAGILLLSSLQNGCFFPEEDKQIKKQELARLPAALPSSPMTL